MYADEILLKLHIEACIVFQRITQTMINKAWILVLHITACFCVSEIAKPILTLWSLVRLFKVVGL